MVRPLTQEKRDKPDLRLDWCSYKAAKYAVEHWHYSQRMPLGRMVRIGVWESDKFIGVIIFSRGASPYLGSRYGLKHEAVCELTRVALREHVWPVSRMLAIAIRLLKRQCAGLRLVVSFADQNHGHHGGIYQAAGWIYTGETGPQPKWAMPDGRILHDRAVNPTGKVAPYFGKRRQRGDVCEAQEIPQRSKHRYLMPLDEDMRRQVEGLRQPYPKRAPDSGAPPPRW